MLTTYPDSNNLSTYAASFSQKADFGRFHSIGLQFDDYIASSHGLTASKRGEIAPLEPRHAVCTLADSS